MVATESLEILIWMMRPSVVLWGAETGHQLGTGMPLQQKGCFVVSSPARRTTRSCAIHQQMIYRCLMRSRMETITVKEFCITHLSQWMLLQLEWAWHIQWGQGHAQNPKILQKTRAVWPMSAQNWKRNIKNLNIGCRVQEGTWQKS